MLENRISVNGEVEVGFLHLYALRKICRHARIVLEQRGANKSKSAQNIIDEKSKPINEGGLLQYFFAFVKSMAAAHLQYF